MKNHNKVNLKELIIACSFTDKYETKIVSWISDEMPFGVNHHDIIQLQIPNLNLRAEYYLFTYQISIGSTSPKYFCDMLYNATSLTVTQSDFFGSGKKIRPGSSLLLNANFK